MSKVSTNTVSLQFCREASLGVLPGSPLWKLLEPNSIGGFGANITTVARNPISKDRQRKKGTITDLDSPVEFEGDLTGEHVLDFMSGFCFAVPNGPNVYGDQETDTITGVDGTAEEYDVSANGDLAAGQLIYCRGFTNSENNGLKTVAAGATGTTIAVEEDIVDEVSPPYNARIEVCGFEGAAGDLEINASLNLISTVLDFTTLDLTVGQVIWIGGTATLNRFALDISSSVNRGWARITAIAANELTLDKKSSTYQTDDGAAKEIHFYYGNFIRNVSVDDADFDEASYQFEATYPDLEAVGTDCYEYAKGNYCNQITFNLPLADKANCSFGFVGTDTEPPDTSRATGADTPLEPVQTVAFNTSADIARLRITEVDETGLSTYFKSLSLTINNNASPEKALANLGAVFMNIGNFDVDIEAQLLFTNKAVPAAIRANTTVTMDFSLRNDDGGLFFDLPAMTLGGGDKEFPENETVLINTPAQAFEDPTLGTSIGVSLFPYLPSS